MTEIKCEEHLYQEAIGYCPTHTKLCCMNCLNVHKFHGFVSISEYKKTKHIQLLTNTLSVTNDYSVSINALFSDIKDTIKHKIAELSVSTQIINSMTTTSDIQDALDSLKSIIMLTLRSIKGFIMYDNNIEMARIYQTYAKYLSTPIINSKSLENLLLHHLMHHLPE